MFWQVWLVHCCAKIWRMQLDDALIYRCPWDEPLEHLNAIFHQFEEMVAFDFSLLKVLHGDSRKPDLDLGYGVM